MITTYPDLPGFKVPGPSKQAAESVRGQASTLRELVLRRLRVEGPRTADEVAGVLNASVLAIRPRFSELLRMGRIEDTGQRRKNDSGHSATVWRRKA